MDTIIRKTGLYASLSVIILTLAFGLTVIFFPSGEYKSAEEFVKYYKVSQMIPVIPGILLVLANIPLFAALYYYADSEKKIFGLAGILFGTGYMVCSGLNYYIQLRMVGRNIALADINPVEMFFMQDPSSFSYAADNLGYTFLSFAFLAFSGIFNRRGLNSWIKTFSILYGISGLLGSIGYIANISLLENLVFISALPYLACIILIFIEFRQIRTAS
ncbi:MAG: hypothetical protein JXB00_04250 [Bacteroidales bacterium]|nr:hypothetical protein [Bacteroidales bacterium]